MAWPEEDSLSKDSWWRSLENGFSWTAFKKKLIWTGKWKQSICPSFYWFVFNNGEKKKKITSTIQRGVNQG